MLTFRFRLRVKRKRLGRFLHTSRPTPWRSWGLDGGSDPNLRCDVVDRFLRSLGKIDAARDTATLSQRGARGLSGLIGGRHLPEHGGGRGERKGRGAREDRRDLGERNVGLDRKGRGDWSGPHRARGGKRPVLGLSTGGGRRSFKRDTIVLAIVVIPPLADTRRSVPSNKDKALLGKLLLVKLEMDDKAETVPLELLRTALTSCKSTNRIAYSPRPREGRREMIERVYVLAGDLGSGLPIIKGEPEGNLLLESDVANKDRPVESRRPGSRERQSLDIDIGVRVGGIRQCSGVIGINNREHSVRAKGGWTG